MHFSYCQRMHIHMYLIYFPIPFFLQITNNTVTYIIDHLNDIGSRWTLKDEEDQQKKHPMNTNIDQAKNYLWKIM